jgi:isopenicillin-N epimerase
MLGVAAMKLRAARADLACYVNAEARDVVLVENCTAAATATIRSARLRAGDVVIHLSTAYGMVKNALRHAADAVGADVLSLAVEFRGGGSPPAGAGGAPLAERLAELCDGVAASGRRVAMVTFDHIASCPGAIMPVAQMARVCKQRNVPTVLADAAHALGQVRLDLRALEAAGVTHFMADAHKWLYSPKGSAMLWVTREAQASMYPSVVGAVCSNSRTTNFDPAALANLSEFERRFQYTGTRDYTPLVAVADALRWREKVGESAILGYNHSLAVWGQEFLASEWNTETLVPPECTAFMAHARVPVSTPGAAALLNRRLREERATHVMAFELPARAHLGETEPTHWVRPCAQLFVSRNDFAHLAAATKALAGECEAAAKAACAWLARTRARLMRERALERAEEAALAAEAAAAGGRARARHAVTVGFEVAPASVPHISGSFGAGARTDSAFDLAAVEAVAKYSAGALGTPNAAAKAARDATTSVSEEAAKTAAVNYTNAGPFSSPRSVGFLPALAEEGVVSGVVGKLGALALGKGLGYAAASPVSIIDVSGTSSASSVGTPREGSVDGAGFALPEWAKTPEFAPRTATQ